MNFCVRKPLGVAGLVLTIAVISFSPGGADGGFVSAASPKFSGSIEKIDGDLRKRITGNSWHHGCPVPIAKLRLLRVRHWDFDREVSRGYLMVNVIAARPMLRVMRRLFQLHYPIRRMRLVDAYGSDDHRSMRADNTSAFNCREVSGRPGVWSQHAYGLAIDINTVENPYVSSSGSVSPPNGAPFAKRRPHGKGMITPGGRVVRAFARIGWEWGGNWSGTKDFQHFSATGT
ncbi:MAG: M15 family metallopeptidase [Thermoleophilia bacterium]|nr:M15 family metallopeptidase [Thermoleophilia bacterium]